jgi:hypothetical protein
LAVFAGASPESLGPNRSVEMLFPRRLLPSVLLPILLGASVHAQTDPAHIAKAAPPSDPFARVTKEQWRADLRFLASELPARHANAFHHTPQDRFNAEVADLDRRIDGLNGDEIYIGLDRIANLVGDGHTFVEFPDDIARLPVQIKQFGDEFRVTAVAPGVEKALGARVLRIQDTPIARARELLLTLTPQDETPFLAQARVERFLTLGIVLHGYGIISDRRVATLALADEAGREFIVEARATAPNEEIKWVPVFKEPPLFRQRPDETCWYTYLPEARTVYCAFRGYNGLGKHSAGLFKLVSEQHPTKLVIDMRENGGGDYTVGLRYLVRPIRELPSINQKGHLYVLIGPQTFSAAMSNAAHFRAQTAALLVGQPIGEKPNSYQESRRTKLPNSQLTLCYSVRFYRFVEGGENLIRPDREIIPSWAEFKDCRDPVLEWVLKQEAK